MKHARFPLVLLFAASLTASSPVGIYGIVDTVVLEPNAQSPERIQVWGAFAYVNGADNGMEISPVNRGYLYFKLPVLIPGFNDQPQVDIVKREWSDLKAVAGTGQAIGFGRWSYIGGFAGLQPDSRGVKPPYILERVPQGGAPTDLRVRPESEPPREPATYQTNAGIVKLSERGSHADIVKQLKDALKR
ncbi:MAG: hypothetical protein ACRD44_18525 [Bryobacteraceae bacterium]